MFLNQFRNVSLSDGILKHNGVNKVVRFPFHSTSKTTFDSEFIESLKKMMNETFPGKTCTKINLVYKFEKEFNKQQFQSSEISENDLKQKVLHIFKTQLKSKHIKEEYKEITNGNGNGNGNTHNDTQKKPEKQQKQEQKQQKQVTYVVKKEQNGQPEQQQQQQTKQSPYKQKEEKIEPKVEKIESEAKIIKETEQENKQGQKTEEITQKTEEEVPKEPKQQEKKQEKSTNSSRRVQYRVKQDSDIQSQTQQQQQPKQQQQQQQQQQTKPKYVEVEEERVMYQGIFAKDEVQGQEKVKEYVLQNLHFLESIYPKNRQQILADIEEIKKGVLKYNTKEKGWKYPDSLHITSLFVGGKQVEKLEEREQEIHNEFQSEKEINIESLALAYVPGHLICGYCKHDEQQIKIANKYPHMTMMLRGWQAVQSNNVLEAVFENNGKFDKGLMKDVTNKNTMQYQFVDKIEHKDQKFDIYFIIPNQNLTLSGSTKRVMKKYKSKVLQKNVENLENQAPKQEEKPQKQQQQQQQKQKQQQNQVENTVKPLEQQNHQVKTKKPQQQLYKKKSEQVEQEQDVQKSTPQKAKEAKVEVEQQQKEEKKEEKSALQENKPIVKKKHLPLSENQWDELIPSIPKKNQQQTNNTNNNNKENQNNNNKENNENSNRNGNKRQPQKGQRYYRNREEGNGNGSNRNNDSNTRSQQGGQRQTTQYRAKK